MAIQTQLGLISGSAGNLSQPITVWDDGGVKPSLTAALNAALAVAPATLNGWARGADPEVQETGGQSWVITFRYQSSGQLSVWQTDGRGDIQANAQERRDVYFAPEVAAWDSSGLRAGGSGWGGLIVPPDGNAGVTIPPPPRNLGWTQTINLTALGPGWRKLVASLAERGTVNSAPIGGYAVGEIALVSVGIRQISQTKATLELGWSYIPNVVNATWDEVTGITAWGHDLIWPVVEPITDRNGNRLAQKVVIAVASRVRPFADLSVVGFAPPS